MSTRSMQSFLFLAVLAHAPAVLADDYPAAPATDPRTPQLQQIFPFRPLATSDVMARVNRMTEDASSLKNIYQIDAGGFSKAGARTQPWASSFWPLIQGQIANAWHDKTFLDPMNLLKWQTNFNDFKKHRDKDLAKPYDMSEKQLARLSPAEKYDLLLGDTNFDLTNRIWNYVSTYGEGKSWAFISSINIPDGYRLPEAKSDLAFWEGICHGWALAAGGSPRAEHTVTVTLPNGKRMPIYPTDMKALLSLTYANSVVQDNVLMEGIRCDNPKPNQDQYGRFTDTVPVQKSEQVLPRCADVHPAVWYLSVVNLAGVQGRAFVAEVDANVTVNNHPFNNYEMRYFNPMTGKIDTLQKSVLAREAYKNDPFVANRNPESRSIVGVEMKMNVINWTWPKEGDTDSADKDPIKSKTMRFDLELDGQGNVIGGQWRVERKAEDFNGGSTNQPDFFWTLPKNYMDYFQPVAGLPAWNPLYQPQAPRQWLDAARSAHAFTYNVTREFGFDEKCTVINDVTREVSEVPCEFKFPRPQPLINLVQKLLELARQ